MKRARVVTGTVGLTAAMLIGMAASAFAVGGNGEIKLDNGYGALTGSIYWYPAGVNHGGMNVSGVLKDKSCDSNAVKVSAKRPGLKYAVLWTNTQGCGASVSGSKYIYDPGSTRIDKGYVELCRYNSWRTTNCTEQYRQR